MISVIIPTYNRPEMLLEAISSVLSQRPGIVSEIIVINDGGNPPPWIPNGVTLINAPSNNGHVAARNIGIQESSSEWVMFLDDDDLIHDKHCQVMLAAAELAGARFVHSDAIIFGYTVENSRRSITWQKVFAYDATDDGMRQFSTFIPSGSIIRRDLLEQLMPLDESIKHHWDWDLYLRCLTIEKPVRVPFAGVRYAIHEAGNSARNQSQSIKSMRESLNTLQSKHNLGELSTENFLTLLDSMEIKGRWSATSNPWTNDGIGSELINGVVIVHPPSSVDASQSEISSGKNCEQRKR